jgi:p-cymene monooxygenase electron transfer component
MFSSLFRKSPPKTHHVVIDGHDAPLVVVGKETILEAALRAGIDFPNDCRVGACGACKCRLLEGNVEERSEKAYVLHANEIARGYILGCQSAPKSDLRIALDRPRMDRPTHPLVTTRGVVVGRRALTHDTAEITVRVETPLAYTAGQYARVTLPEVSSEDRCYSFARAPSASGDRELAFYVRVVPGGALSPVLVHGEVVGQNLLIEGPHGDFHRRSATTPMLLIAGGSGLAPIRALIEDAIARGCRRPMTLLFGARTEQDLYELDSIEAFCRAAAGNLTFHPILSHEPSDSSWGGLRGFVTSAIERHGEPSGEAYLCGPPPMIDAAIAELQRCGMAQSAIFFDKFTDKSHAGKAS